MASHPCQSGRGAVSDHGHAFQALAACAASPSFGEPTFNFQLSSVFIQGYPRYFCLKQICLIARNGEDMCGKACGWNLLSEWLQASTSYAKIGHDSTPAPHMPSEPQKGLACFVSFVMLGKAFSFLNAPEGVCEWPYPGHRADSFKAKKQVISKRFIDAIRCAVRGEHFHFRNLTLKTEGTQSCMTRRCLGQVVDRGAGPRA